MDSGQTDLIASVEAYLSAVSAHKRKYWTAPNLLSFSPGGAAFPDDSNTARKVPNAWFRGQSEDWPLLPKVFRHDYLETDMLLDVRRRAHLLPGMPRWDDVISWYFVLQHHAFPTRLIDWTENPLAALYFAIEQYDRYSGEHGRFTPVVWLIQPNAFNWALRGSTIIPGTGPDEAVVSPGEGVDPRFAKENIIAPWTRTNGPDRPLAIAGSYVHACTYRRADSRCMVVREPIYGNPSHKKVCCPMGSRGSSVSTQLAQEWRSASWNN